MNKKSFARGALISLIGAALSALCPLAVCADATADQIGGGSMRAGVGDSNLRDASPIAIPAGDASGAFGAALGDRRSSEFGVLPLTTPPLTVGQIRAGQHSSFVDYVRDIVGVSLPVFGNELFQSAPSTFAPLDAAQVNGDYTLGPGDRIQVRAWGMPESQSINQMFTVDRSGGVYIPHVGAIHIGGVRYRDLQSTLKNAAGRVFTNFDLTASIAQTRAVQIYVVGNAVRPGTYTLSATSTLLNALFSSGGPSGIGSMRDIQLKRGGDVITRFDMYDMLVKGDKSRDASLQDGDVIYIPEIGQQIALLGNVKRPAVYELKGEGTLADAAQWAGGFDNAVASGRLIVQRNVDNKYQTIADLAGSEAQVIDNLRRYSLVPASVIRVFSPGAVPVPVGAEREFVTLSGETSRPGVYQIRRGETLREFMARLGGVNDVGYLYGMQVTRDEVRREQQKRLDEIADRTDSEIDAALKQRIARLTDRDAIAAVQADAVSEHAVVRRMRMLKAPGRIVLGLQGANVGAPDLPELPLRDADTIYVPRRPDTVDVFGSVNQQGSFIYKEYFTAADYLKLAGGETDSGDRSEMFILRADGSIDIKGSWLMGMGGVGVNPGDAIVIPEKIERSDFVRELKDWTTILYQFGLGAAGLKVLK